MELGVTVAQAEKMTVTVLREKIREQRQILKMAQDPMMQVPKGLERMLLEDLKIEAMNRDLPVEDEMTRPQLIVLIREDVEYRLAQSTTSGQEDPIPIDQATSSNVIGGRREMDGDYEMLTIPHKVHGPGRK